jgi:tRNA G37 N-methylase TrmD
MVTRRHALRRKSERLPAMEEDASLSKFLQNPTFTRPEDIEGADVPSVMMPLISGKATREVEEEVEVEAERAVKRRKTVHFA